jgi:hypothetical protein
MADIDFTPKTHVADGFFRHTDANRYETTISLLVNKVKELEMGLIDTIMVGPLGQATLNNNIMNEPAGPDPVDMMPPGEAPFRWACFQVTGSAGITAGQIIPEQSNNGTNWFSLPYYDEAAGPNPTYAIAATSIAANANRAFVVQPTMRYIRLRISTAFTGGTVSCVTRLGRTEFVPRVQVAVQTSSANMTATATPVNPTSGTLNTTASTNAAAVKTSAGNLYSVTVSNPTATPCFLKYYNKNSAPTLASDVPVLVIPVPANSFQSHQLGAVGYRFASGLARAVVGGAADNDATSAPAGVKITEAYI